MSLSQKQKKSIIGFTIIELLVVIVVIAILATIVTVAYNGVRKQTIVSVLKDTLSQTTQAMEAAAVDTGNFASLPNSIKIANNVGIALTQVSDANASFCVNATYKTYNDIAFHVTKGGSAEEGLCEGEVVAVLGDYNYEAGGAALDPTMMSSVGTASASGAMQFNATTNENWTQISLSWNTVPGATQYRVNHKSSATATWYSRRVDDGSGSVAADSASSWSPAYSNLLAPSITSLSWASASVIPQDASQTHYYRVQYKDASGNWSEWTEVALSPLTSPTRTIPKVKNFKVTPSANWSSIALTWDGINNFAKLPGVKFRINHRTSSTATWYSRQVTDGSGSVAADSASSWSPAYSNAMSPSTTSLTWTNTGVIPQDASQTHEYRIQIISGDKAGEWTTVTLNPLSYTNTTLPAVTNFKATPSANWSSLALSWDTIGSVANLPGVKFRVNHRTSSTATWYSRRIDDGSGSQAWDSPSAWSPAYSNLINPTINAMTWTSTSVIPQDASQTHEYRIQVISGNETGPWTTLTLNPLSYTNLSMPDVSGFTVTRASDWSSITLSWNGAGNFTNIPGAKFRINHRTSSTGTWYSRRIDDGSGSIAWDSPSVWSPAYTNLTPIGTTSLTWTSATSIPQSAGQTHEYRIQVISGSQAGSWATATISR